MRFVLDILISLAVANAGLPAKAANKFDMGYRVAAYYYYTSATTGDFLKNIPLKDSAAKETLIRLSDKSGASRVKRRMMEWNSKTRTATITLDRKTAKVGFIADNTGYFTVNGKRVKLEAGAGIEKTWNQVAAILKPGTKHAWFQFLVPEAEAQGIGILEGILLAAAVTGVVLGVAALVNQEFVQPMFCTSSVDPRKCLRSISETVLALTEDAVPKVTLTSFQCKDKNLAHASFIRDPNIALEYDGAYRPDTTKTIVPPALFPMPVEVPVSGGPTSMSFKTYYTETPDLQSKCTYELDEKFNVSKIISGEGTKICENIGTNNPEALLAIQAGSQFPIDMLMECCRSKVCEEQVAQYVKPAPKVSPQVTTPGQGNATE